MADEAIVEQQTPADSGADNQQNTPPPTSTQVAVPANNGWEAEKRAFIADLQKERRARQAVEQQATSYKTQYETEQRRVRALSGVDPLNPHEAEAAEVRNRFKQVVSREQLLEMAGLTEDDVASIKANREQAQQLQQLQNRGWDRHGREMFSVFDKEVASALGGEHLTERQTKRLIGAFVQECQADPELLERYESGDVSAIKQFTTEWIEDWLKPAQRKAQAVDLSRRQPFPSGKDRTVATTSGKRIDPNDPKAVEDLLVAGFRERGGAFRDNQ